MLTAQLIDSMGNDLSVVNAARVSFNKEKKIFDKDDERLIRYLAQHNHWTPFSHVMVTFRITAPIFVLRQWYRHTVGFARNEVSRRYVDDEPEFFYPDTWRGRPTNGMKQGSSAELVDYDIELVNNVYDLALDVYEDMIEKGVAPEQARMILPQSMVTSVIETASLYAYARLYNLRIDPHAQKEIRDLAVQVGHECQRIAPVSWFHLTEEGKDASSNP